MSQRVRLYTAEDLAAHNSASSCWVARRGRVYDVTSFLPDHPGGDDLIVKWAGKEVEAAMKDKDEHDHSESAYEMLEEYVIGKIAKGENVVRDGESPPPSFLLSFLRVFAGSAGRPSTKV